jgi:oligoribonuclease NrnB/cAMP/cGMP phosphodiesterase (DHH superfamily)
MKIAVLYHADADGFGAAYACWKGLTEEALYIPVQYSQPVPEIPETVEVLYIVDFSYDRVTCEALAARFGLDKIVILDHHKTAEKDLAGLPFATFDQQKSGAVLAWEHMYPFMPVPDILQYVQDRDLWKFALPKSKEINAYIATLPNEFEAWDAFDLETAMHCGQAIIAFQERQICRAIRNKRLVDIAGYTVLVVNLSDNISEVGNEMCQRFPEYPFSASYCDRADGQRSYSLRSVGEFDVSAIAKQFGGGGHRNAAGYTVLLETL